MAKGIEKVIGTEYFDKVDVTDPCYDRDVWCRVNDLQVKPGLYTGVAELVDEGVWGIRVKKIGIYFTNENTKRYSTGRCTKPIGAIGVDAGLAGFFKAPKPNYNDDEWHDICQKIRDKNYIKLENGMFSSSGYGDGEYPVVVRRNAKEEITAVEIRFI